MSHINKLCLMGLCLIWTNTIAGDTSETGLFQLSGRWYLQRGATTHGPILPDSIVVRRTDRQAVTLQTLQARGYSLVIKVTELCPAYYLLKTSSINSYNLYQALSTDLDYDLVDYDRVGELSTGASSGSGDGNLVGITCASGTIFEGEPTCIERPDGYPNDAGFKYQTYLALHRVLDAWDLSRGDSSIVLAVVDSGIDINDQDLYGNIYVNPEEDLNGNGRPDFTSVGAGGDLDGQDNDANGFKDDLSGWNFACGDHYPHSFKLSHGTSVASIAAGMGNSCNGICGIAGGWGTGYRPHEEGTFVKGVSLMPIRVADEDGLFAVSSAVLGIRYAAENGARIINTSLGWNEDLQWVRDCLGDLMATHDFALVGAGGNSDANNPGIQYPAAYPGVITVSVCDLDGSAPVTGYRKGPSVNLIAQSPVLADTTDRFNNCGFATTGRGGVDNPECFSGSSAASPQVSGTVGLMLSVNPFLTRDEVIFILDATAMKIEMQGYYFTCASGYGTLDAFAAVNEALNRDIPDTLSLNNSISTGYVGKAYQTITTGGPFLLASGRQAVLHAGERIVLGPGTRILNGSNFNADVGYHETCPTLTQVD